jgi:hypothetical protein
MDIMEAPTENESLGPWSQPVIVHDQVAHPTKNESLEPKPEQVNMSGSNKYPNPYNWIFTKRIASYEDIAELEIEIMRFLRTMGKTCPALLCQSYIKFRSLITRFVVYGVKDVDAYSLSVELDGRMVAVQEIDHDECLVTLSWKECLYPGTEEIRYMGRT